MALLQRILTSLILLLICTMIQALEFKNYSKNWSSKDGQVFHKGNDFDTPDNSILYATCKNESDIENFHCDLIVDAPTEIKTCNLKFRRIESPTNDMYAFLIDHVQRINGNKIFIVYSFNKIEQGMITMITTRVSVVNRSDCSMTELVEYTVRANEDKIIDPVIYNNTFDIFVSNYSLCQMPRTCRITYDQTGEQINKSTPFPIDIQAGKVTPIASASPLKGFFVRGYDKEPLLEVKYVNPEGEVKTLITEIISPYDFLNSKISNAHEMGGICYRNEELKSYCLQFDSNGEMLANISMKIENNEVFRGSYNIAKGQMLVFTEPYGKNWTVRKITAQTLEKPLELDFTCKARAPTYEVIVKETKDQFIFYLKCLEMPDKGESVPMNMKYSVQYVKKYMLN